MKRIAINGFFLTRPYSGIGSYTQTLLASLSYLDNKNHYTIIVPEKISINLPANFEIAVLPYFRVANLSLKKIIWEQWQIPRFCRKNKINVLHTPYPATPYSGFFRKLNFFNIVTIHDVIPWVDKRYTKKLRAKIYQFISRHTLAFADTIICVSKDTKYQLDKLINAPKKTIVIYNVIHDSVSETFPARETSFLPEINKPYFLYVGGYDPRKNVIPMIDAFFAANHGQKFKLVLVGKSYLESGISGLRIVDTNLVYTGFIDKKTLGSLYKNCFAFVNFSEAEGFNLPLLEAAAAGAVIGTSDIPVHREVLGNAAIFADPKKPDSLMKIFTELMNMNGKERGVFVKSARAEATKFNWRTEINKLLAIYGRH